MYDEDMLLDGWMEPGWMPDAANRAGEAPLTRREYAFLDLPPELFFASELFLGRYVRRRFFARGCSICSTCADRSLQYTGVRLDQFDQDVFLACAARFPRQESSAPRARKIDLGSLARDVLKGAGTEKRRRIAASLRRLESGRIRIRDRRFTCYLKPVQKVLFDNRVEHCLVELNPEMLRSLQSIRNFKGFVRERFLLPKFSMDRWFHGVMHCGRRICIPFAGLPALSGNAGAVPVQVERSLNRLRLSIGPERPFLGEGGVEIGKDSRRAGERP